MISIMTAQQLQRVEVMRREALADATRHGYALNEVIERSVRLELAAALSITEAAAGGLIAQADALVNRYPAALDSLAGARITARHASLLVEMLDGVDPALRDELAPRAVALAEAQPVGTFRRLLRKLVDSAQASTLSERAEEALRTRRVSVQPVADGMADLLLRMPAVEAYAAFARATATAKVLAVVEGEERTLDQLRADVLSDLLIDGETSSLVPGVHGIRATVAVTVPVLALLDDEFAATPDGVATVEGVGPIPIERARELCGGATDWMRVLTHPETGVVLSVGRDCYSPPASLRRLLKWRAETCMAPGCNIPASRCEIDHTLAWQDGGTTSLGNLAPLCKGHHTVKHHGRWRVEQVAESGGGLLWVSPAGRRYRTDPERRVPDWRVAERRVPDWREPERGTPDWREPVRATPDRRVPDRRVPVFRDDGSPPPF
ncbi:DUF222 domain-containing protein [Microbacterium rhizomatis]|uniref:DUF222 domain-containing protein n=2 Tax=Microbacterium rhizomatis TaxID=1631477 RepID=A0A5J5J5Y9_9MICO|nr:DUF222 domain-containing protein [Microbacterium rhizomatis]